MHDSPHKKQRTCEHNGGMGYSRRRQFALWVNLEMVANIGVRETLMLSGTIQPYSQRQTVLRTNDGDFLILGQEIHRLGLWQMQRSGLLWGQKATAQADQSFINDTQFPGIIGIIKLNTLQLDNFSTLIEASKQLQNHT